MQLPPRLSPENVKERWRVEVGGGYAGVAVEADQVVVMDRGTDGTERALVVDRRDGTKLWEFRYSADYGDLDYGSGPRATPTISKHTIYTVGAVGHVHAFDRRKGEPRWQIDAARELSAQTPQWGHSASPLVHGDLLILQLGARPGGTLIALDRRSGKERWRALDDRPGYASPVIATVGDETQIIIWTADAAHGVRPSDGVVRWTAPFRTSNFDVAIANPLVHEGHLFLSGYWDGSRVYRLQPDSAKLVWEARVPSCLMATPLAHGERVFTLDKARGFLAVRWQDGEVAWRDDYQVNPKERNPHASIVWAGDDGHVVALNSSGELLLGRVQPQGYVDLGRASIIGRTWAHPAFAGQDVFARSDSELVCVRLVAGAKEDTAPGR